MNLKMLGGTAVCVILAVVMVLVAQNDSKFNANAVTITGRVDKVTKKVEYKKNTSGRERTRTRKTKFAVDYSYEVDGKTYNDHETLSHDVPEGPITVYVEKGDPSDARLDKPSVTVDYLLAVVFLIAGVVLVVQAFRAKAAGAAG